MQAPHEAKSSGGFTGKLVRAPWCYRLWLLAGSRERLFSRLVEEFGDFVHYRGVIEFYQVNHPALVKQVLQSTHDVFDKRSPLYDRFSRAFGAGLVVAEGDAWKRRRMIVQQLMGPKRIRSYFDTMVECADRTAQRIRAHCDPESSSFDLAPLMNHLTLDIIGRSMFSGQFEQLHDSITRWTEVIDHYSSKSPLPIVRSAWFPSRLNYRFRRALTEFHQCIQQMIDLRRESGADDLLTLLLREQSSVDEPPLTDQEIRDEVLGMIIGGHETSGVALTWIWYELCQNPQVEQRLQDEWSEVLGDRPLHLDDVPKLRYTRMVIQETLRLHPPFWFENRNVVRDVDMGGVRIPAGAMVVFSRHTLHRHPGFWKEPDQFDPNRFEPGREENSHSSHAYVPFGGGPRVCVGLHFAMQELVVLLTVLGREFQFDLDRSERHEATALMTMRLKNGLRVTASQREPRQAR
ncbi:cytochrome P450 [Aeoliella sp. SH292]|uniref:cytochrome P450 n=1 Tax=Aeoliella sp. SH292 TaxID=3454464 RepID=UPI003F96CD08